jgi:hypothetical protein
LLRLRQQAGDGLGSEAMAEVEANINCRCRPVSSYHNQRAVDVHRTHKWQNKWMPETYCDI